MAVSSPYAVFRAVDLGWPEASPSAPSVQPLPLPVALPATPLAEPRSQPISRPRSRPARHSFIQGTLFSAALLSS